MTQAGVDMGLTAEQSYRLGVATFQGASELAARSTESADVLRQRVTSKGGTTHAAITHMQAQQVPEHFVADRKSTRLNSSHSQISYAVFCLKKKKKKKKEQHDPAEQWS